jgi:hypothetical protein
MGASAFQPLIAIAELVTREYGGLPVWVNTIGYHIIDALRDAGLCRPKALSRLNAIAYT